MRKHILLTIAMLIVLTFSVLAHRGKTDSYGGHFVRSEGFGYAVGSYHIHNSDGTLTECDPPGNKKYEYIPSSDSSSSSKPSFPKQSSTKPASSKLVSSELSSDAVSRTHSNDDSTTDAIVGVLIVVFGFFGIPVIFGIINHFKHKKERRAASDKVYQPQFQYVNNLYHHPNHRLNALTSPPLRKLDNSAVLPPPPESTFDTSQHSHSAKDSYSVCTEESSYHHLTNQDHRDILEYLSNDSQQPPQPIASETKHFEPHYLLEDDHGMLVSVKQSDLKNFDPHGNHHISEEVRQRLIESVKQRLEDMSIIDKGE